jgi:hypothetical protein
LRVIRKIEDMDGPRPGCLPGLALLDRYLLNERRRAAVFGLDSSFEFISAGLRHSEGRPLIASVASQRSHTTLDSLPHALSRVR